MKLGEVYNGQSGVRTMSVGVWVNFTNRCRVMLQEGSTIAGPRLKDRELGDES